MTEANRYGAQGILDRDGEPACCHHISLEKKCDGCIALRETARRPTLVGIGDVTVEVLEDEPRPVPVPAGVGYEAPVAGMAEMRADRDRVELEEADTDADHGDELEDTE
jgi:hypothetical protein